MTEFSSVGLVAHVFTMLQKLGVMIKILTSGRAELLAGGCNTSSQVDTRAEQDHAISEGRTRQSHVLSSIREIGESIDIPTVTMYSLVEMVGEVHRFAMVLQLECLHIVEVLSSLDPMETLLQMHHCGGAYIVSGLATVPVRMGRIMVATKLVLPIRRWPI